MVILAERKMELKATLSRTKSLWIRIRIGLWPSEVMSTRMSIHGDRASDLCLERTATMEAVV